MSLEQRKQPNAEAALELAKAHDRSGLRVPCRTCKAPIRIRKVGTKWRPSNLDGSVHHCHLEPREDLTPEVHLGPPLQRGAVRIQCAGCGDQIDVSQKTRGGLAHYDAGTNRAHRCLARNVSRTHNDREHGHAPSLKNKPRPAAWKELDLD